MDLLGSWAIPIIVVGVLGTLMLGFALLIGRWIDAQSNTVVSRPREKAPRRRRGTGEQ